MSTSPVPLVRELRNLEISYNARVNGVGPVKALACTGPSSTSGLSTFAYL